MKPFRFAAGVLVASFAITGCTGSTVTAPPMPAPSLLPPNPIKHVIVLMQENRSLNNLFMGFPGADTSSTGAAQGEAAPVKLHSMTLEGQGFPGQDIAHDHKAFTLEYNNGKMDGFNKESFGETWTAPNAGNYAYAYVNRQETQPYWDMAKQYTLGDHMFSTETTGSFVAHQELIAGSAQLNANESLTDFPSSQPWGCDAPVGTVTSVIFKNGTVSETGGPFPCFSSYKTMADLLDASNVSWKYYVASMTGNDADFSGLVWDGFDAIKKVACPSKHGPTCDRGPDWKNISSPAGSILTDIKKGSLPSVSWVIPALFDSDHPSSGHNFGPSWVAAVVNAVGKSKYWDSTAIVVTWDEWGGFYDNVPPPQLDYTSLNLRVPLLIISPYAKPGNVSHTQYEIGSILKYIEQSFNLGSLGSTDVRANSLIDSFDFTQTPTKFKVIPAPYPSSMFMGRRAQPSAAEIKEMIEDEGVPE
jgi:phospholipase C